MVTNVISQKVKDAHQRGEIIIMVSIITNGSALEACLALLKAPLSISISAIKMIKPERKKEIQEVLEAIEGRANLLRR